MASVHGCPQSVNGGAGTAHCSVGGGTLLSIFGDNFGPKVAGSGSGSGNDALTITVGGLLCTNPTMTVAHRNLTCKLPSELVLATQRSHLALSQAAMA